MTYLEKLIQKQSDLLDALLADTGNMDSYSIDGQAVSRARWRQWVIDSLKVIQDLIQDADPYEIRTVGY